MDDRVIVTDTDGIKSAFENQVSHITLKAPEGESADEFLANMVVYATTLPQLEGFDPYEIESIIREMAA
jgi:hypothetical protein